MNISKADILNPESTSDDPSSSVNPAVKLALAETHVINETKSYLESHGVLLSSFSSLSSSSGQQQRVRRSETTILVKNIPYGTSLEQIHEMFSAHGALERVLPDWIAGESSLTALTPYRQGLLPSVRAFLDHLTLELPKAVRV